VSEKRYIIDDVHEGHAFEWKLELTPSHGPNIPQVDCSEPSSGHRPGFHGGVDDYDESRPCWCCRGSGKMDDPKFRWKPEPPEELVKELRRVWREHWNKLQNERFKLS
jgi:hypothetical protein